MSVNTEDLMSPDASPGEATPNTGVRRVNNLPMYIVGGLMTVFLIVMVLVAADRAAQQNRQASAKDEKTGNTSLFANEIAGSQKDGIIPAANARSFPIYPRFPSRDRKTWIGHRRRLPARIRAAMMSWNGFAWRSCNSLKRPLKPKQGFR